MVIVAPCILQGQTYAVGYCDDMNHRWVQGKRCLITAAARGIGATAARLFAREGASVVLFDLKDELVEHVGAEMSEQAEKPAIRTATSSSADR